MQESEAEIASEKLVRLKSDFGVNVTADWGFKDSHSGIWQGGSWATNELDLLHDSITLLSVAMGGYEKVLRNTGEVTVKKEDIGSQGGNALAHLVHFNSQKPFSAWTVVHEFAHAWDANYGWRLSKKLERYTGGFTSKFWSLVKKSLGQWDAGPNGSEDQPGRRGRRPGCNAAGYFYGDKPSGSNWSFDRREDFAESIAMYVGLQSENALSGHARGRVARFELQNGTMDPTSRVIDNWADYSKYFYPEDGDYKTTKRWKFVEELAQGTITIT